MIQFLSPLLMWGMLLGSIPIIIHLLNRRRYRRVDWAPMRQLRLTIRRNRRRVQIEQWLLLLVRVALPLVLFLFLARPVVNPTGLESWFQGTGRASQIVLLDDSLSMGYAPVGTSSFERGREVAGAVLEAARPQDRCTLVTTSAPKTPIFHEAEGADRAGLARDARALAMTDTHALWPTVLAGVDEVVAACTYPTKNLTIITDLRRSGWDPGVGAVARRWAESGVHFRVVDVGADEVADVALEALSPLDRTVLAGTDSHWEATVRNNSPRVLNRLKASLRVDDRPTDVVLPEIPPRAVAKVPLTVRFPNAGMHDLSLALPDDELNNDNRRWAAVPVKDTLLIRLVDGDPSPDPFGSEVDYLAAPLSIGVGDAEAWRIEVAQEENFLGPRLDPADVIVLANVTAPTFEQAEKLRALVASGTGLLIYTGSKLDTGLYNDRLGRGSAPLLPALLKGQLDEALQGLVVDPVRPSPIEKLLELKPSALARIAVRQLMAVEEPAATAGDVRVLARWNDPGHSAAIVERVVGLGRVLLWTTSADRAGNDWPVEPSFVLAVREAIRGSARPTSWVNTVTAGDRPRRVVRSSQPVGNARVTPPEGGEPKALAAVALADAEAASGTPGSSIELPDTRRAGLYRLAWEEGVLGAQGDTFASNPDAREVGLERLSERDLKTMLAPLAVEVAVPRGDGAELPSATGREAWRELAWGLLGLLLLEPIIAAWVGRSR